MPRILVVDDEPSVLSLFARVFEKDGFEVCTESDGASALDVISKQSPDLAMLDVLLPDMTGLELFRRVQQCDAKLPVVFITGGGSSDTAIEAMQMGALDYLVKPLDLSQVRAVVKQGLEVRRLMSEPVALTHDISPTTSGKSVLVGRCPAMQEVYKAIGRVASQNVTVLIRGESGTGKELVARALYQHSTRQAGPFMAVNCAAIPEALLESELFGHEKGSFTGADRQHIGKFEQCNGGTLFLDEIGDMSLPLQSKMLRVLQDQQFERVGGGKTIQTDVRIIAATNRDLEKMVQSQQFRGDLFYRLNGYSIDLPSLRERGDDLLLLIDFYLTRANSETGRDVRGLSPEAVDLLRRHTWSGNVRELQSVIKQAVLQTTGQVILADFLPRSIRTQPRDAPGQQPGANYWSSFVAERLRDGTEQLYDEALARMEAEVISRVLNHTLGNQVEAARILGITRTTLRTKMKNLGITVDRIVQSEED